MFNFMFPLCIIIISYFYLPNDTLNFTKFILQNLQKGCD
jgi:hypothetical protein